MFIGKVDDLNDGREEEKGGEGREGIWGRERKRKRRKLKYGTLKI